MEKIGGGRISTKPGRGRGRREKEGEERREEEIDLLEHSRYLETRCRVLEIYRRNGLYMLNRNMGGGERLGKN